MRGTLCSKYCNALGGGQGAWRDRCKSWSGWLAGWLAESSDGMLKLYGRGRKGVRFMDTRNGKGETKNKVLAAPACCRRGNKHDRRAPPFLACMPVQISLLPSPAHGYVCFRSKSTLTPFPQLINPPESPSSDSPSHAPRADNPYSARRGRPVLSSSPRQYSPSGC